MFAMSQENIGSPDNTTLSEALSALALAEKNFSKKNWQSAQKLYNVALDKGHPDISIINEKLGDTYCQLKQWDKALDYFSNAMTHNHLDPLSIVRKIVEIYEKRICKHEAAINFISTILSYSEETMSQLPPEEKEEAAKFRSDLKKIFKKLKAKGTEGAAPPTDPEEPLACDAPTDPEKPLAGDAPRVPEDLE